MASAPRPTRCGQTHVFSQKKARLQLLAAGPLHLCKWRGAYFTFIFLPFDFTLALAGTVIVPGVWVAGVAVVVVDSIVVEDGVVSVVVPVMGEVVVEAGVVVVLRVVVVVVPVWALAE